jgi:shikimate dehydrogenase
LQHIRQPSLATSPAPPGDLQSLFEALPRFPLRAALVGRGIQESRTPQMHEGEGARLGLQYGFGLLDFDRLGLPDDALPGLIGAAGREGLAGLNVTHPFKQSIVRCLDALSLDAAAIGAVNAVVFRDGRAVGHNTDCWGFAESFRREMQGAALDRVLLAGAGGAGMAVGRALVELGAFQVSVFDSDAEKAAALADSLGRQFGGRGRAAVAGDLAAAMRSADGLINATPVGMTKYPGSPVPERELRRDLWVADIVYFPAQTDLLRAAAATGSRTLPGRGMAIFQAVKAFELFTGLTPDPMAMSRHFESASRFNAPPDDPAIPPSLT